MNKMNKIVLKNYVLLTAEENKELLKIRNTKHIRNLSLKKEKIELSSHLGWIQSLKNNASFSYYAIFYENELLGGINIFDVNTKIKWGVFFKEHASLLIKSFVPLYFFEHIFSFYNVENIYAEVIEENENAFNYNKSLGFLLEEKKQKASVLILNKKIFFKHLETKILQGIRKRMKKYSFEIKD